MRSLAVGTFLIVAWMLVPAPIALADPPGPTDYKSEVVDVSPATAGFDIEIVGGDSFVLMRVEPGLGVEVIGYQGEPYLRFLPDGTVEENAASPSKYLNEDRYGGELPVQADASASPQWVVVAGDGSFAWHDHRTHWMNPQPPPGLGPGDQVAEGVVPLLLNGAEVDVTVASVWQSPPSPLPVALGLITGLGLAYLVFRRGRNLLTPVVLALAGAATLVGSVAYLSVPSETEPVWSLWVLPATALLLAALAALGPRLGGAIEKHATTLLLIAALELVAWGSAHWGWLWPAIIPTSLPYWLDRFLAATVLTGAAGASASVLASAAAPTPASGGGP